jgi:hypothetical protein
MKRLAWTISLVMVSMVFVTSVWAGRAWVSGFGSDTNACTLAAPCRSFGKAISVASSGDEIVVLDSGGYGAFTIDKSITISVPPGVYAGMIISSGDGILINAGTEDVVILRGLIIVGQGGSYGIRFISGKALYVENCSIKGFNNYGIYFSASGYLSVKDTISRENDFDGIYIYGSSGTVNAVLDRVHLERNSNGLYVVTNAKVTVRDSIAADNSNCGFYVYPGPFTPSELNIENCVATRNGYGIEANASDGNATVRVSNSTVTNNNTGLFTYQEGSYTANLLSRSNNTVEGNTTNGSFTGTFTAK